MPGTAHVGATAGRSRIAVIAGRRGTRARLAQQLSAGGWDLAHTGDLRDALRHVSELQPDIAVFELRLLRAVHLAGLPAVQVLAPETMLVTVGSGGPVAGRSELAELGIFSHVDAPTRLANEHALDQLLGRFDRALQGTDTVIPHLVADESRGARRRSPGPGLRPVSAAGPG